jgi:hypothetical protein
MKVVPLSAFEGQLLAHQNMEVDGLTGRLTNEEIRALVVKLAPHLLLQHK